MRFDDEVPVFDSRIALLTGVVLRFIVTPAAYVGAAITYIVTPFRGIG